MADFKQITVAGVSHPVKDEVARQGLAGKQDKLTFDDTPTANSNNPVKSGGVYQAIQDIDVSSQISGKADKSEMSVVAGTGANADKTTITLKSGTSATVLTQHQDVSGKEDKSNKVTSFSSPTDTQYPSAKLVNDQLATKQGTISDLSTIRSGASAGATAYQKPGTGIPPTDLASAVQTSLGKADTAIQSVTVGTTTTGAAGSSASVTNTGTATEPVLSFTIPQGAQGIQGPQGPQGERGPQGNTGVQVDSVASIIHSIDPTATYAAADVAGADAVQDVLSEVTELGGEVALGAVYDVSAHNNNATFASLSALLSDANLNTLIPTAVRKGGMSIKFVQSSDNTYVQYMYKETDAATAATFVNTANWERVDVGDEVDDLEGEFSTKEIDITGDGTGLSVGRVLPNGIFTQYTTYHYMLFEALADDIISYKAMADTSTVIIGRRNQGSTTYTAIAMGTGTTNYVEGNYNVIIAGTYVICGYNNKTTSAAITRKGRITSLESDLQSLEAKYNDDIPRIDNKLIEIKKEVGVYEVNENLINLCGVLTGQYINYNGGLSNYANASTLYIPTENAAQFKNKGAFSENMAIAFYSAYPFNESSLVEIHKYSDYSPQGDYVDDELTLTVPNNAKYFAFSIINSQILNSYLKASSIKSYSENSLNTRLVPIENDFYPLKESYEDTKRYIGIYSANEELLGVASKLTGVYIGYNGNLGSQGWYSIYYLPIENATQFKYKGGFGLNAAIAFYSSYPFSFGSLVEIHKYSDYSPQENYYTEEITLNVPSGAKYFAVSLHRNYLASAYIKSSQITEQAQSINTRVTELEKNADAFSVDSSLKLQSITDNPLAIIKESGGLAAAFETWGFVGDSIASGEIWGWYNDQRTLIGSQTDKKVNASGTIEDANGYTISEPLIGTHYRPTFVVEFQSNTGLSNTMCVIAKCDSSGNVISVGAIGSTATKYTFQIMENQYVVICYPSSNVPTVRCVSYYVEDNYAISWGQYMARLCGSQGVNYSVGGGTVKKFVLSQGPYTSSNSMAKLKSDPQKQGYIIGLGVNDKDNNMYDANVTDINDIAVDINLSDPTQNANTFAGYYGRCIQEIKATFPDSFIFLVTIPDSGYDEMNTIIRAMPEIFESSFDSLFVLDLAAYLPISAVNQFHMNGIHFNGQGYVYFAYVFCTYIEWLIRKYPSAFKGISLVGKALPNNPT